MVASGGKLRKNPGRTGLLISVLILFLTLPHSGLGKQAQARSGSLGSSPRDSTKSQSSAAKVYGIAELKPTWNYGDETLHTENEFQLGVKLSPTVKLSYTQELNTNLHNPDDDGFNPQAIDGWVRGSFDKIWEGNHRLPMTFGYEARAYFPTHAPKRDAGMVTAIRNYFKLGRSPSEGISFQFYEIPILHLYSDSGAVRENGEAFANPIFENRIEFWLKIALTKKLAFILPVKYYVTKYRSFEEGATLNDDWSHFLRFETRLYRKFTSHLTMGLKFRTGNLLERQDYGYSFGEPFSSGALQFVILLSM